MEFFLSLFQGKGQMMTYFLTGKEDYVPLDPSKNYCFMYLKDVMNES